MTIAEALHIFELQTLYGQDDKSLKKIYYHLAQKYHPDKGGTFEKFVALQEAHLFLKKSLGKSQYGNDENYQTEDKTSEDFEPNQAYDDLQSRFNRLREHYQNLILVVEKYENIFNSQISIINNSNSAVKNLVDRYNQIKTTTKTKLDLDLKNLKKRYEKEWWEYLFPVKKLTQNEYIQASNVLVESFNKTTQNLDDEFVSEMLKMYQKSFQDLVSLLSEV
jgi:curved DNA-binding protein CbpA